MMESKTAMLAGLVKTAQAKGAKARARRVQRRQSTSPVKWLGKEWKALMADRFPGIEVEWTGAEASLAKKLVGEIGFDRTLDMIRHFFETWERRRAAETGTPGFKLLWAMKAQLQAEMEGRVKLPETHATVIASGEYSEETARTNPSQGWGGIKGDDDTYPFKGQKSGW